MTRLLVLLWFPCLLAAVDRVAVEAACDTRVDLATVVAIAAWAEAHPEEEWPRAWGGRLRRAFEHAQRQLPWERRVAIVELAAARGVELEFDPGAMAALEAARAIEEPAAAVAALRAAEERGAVLADPELEGLLRHQIALGELDAAAASLARISQAQREAADLDQLVWIHDLPAPRMRPALAFHSLVGGPGDQAIREVEITADGRAIGHGPGFSVTVDLGDGRGFVSGPLDRADSGSIERNPPLRKAWKADSGVAAELHDPRTGQTLRWLTLQVHDILQQPHVASDAGWRAWGWSHGECEAKHLMADSRLYRLWLLPGNRLGFMGWTDGGNSVFARDPRNLDQGSGIPGFGGGPRVVVGSLDATTGELIGGRTQYALVPHHLVDPWGRVLCGADHGRRAGFHWIDVDSTISPVLPLGGSEQGKETEAHIGSMALRDGWLVLGGATRAPGLSNARNAVQTRNGGDRDGLLAVIRLYR